MPFKRKNNWTVNQIREYIHEGKSQVEIGNILNLSRQRIKQICKQYGLPSTVERRQELKAEKYFAKWGNKQDTDLYRVCRLKFSRKKATALKSGIAWTVQFGELIWPEKCPILGIELDYFTEVRKESSPSFDRIDPSKGYVRGNVQIISWRANRIKNDGSAEEHRLIADYLDSLAGGP